MSGKKINLLGFILGSLLQKPPTPILKHKERVLSVCNFFLWALGQVCGEDTGPTNIPEVNKSIEWKHIGFSFHILLLHLPSLHTLIDSPLLITSCLVAKDTTGLKRPTHSDGRRPLCVVTRQPAPIYGRVLCLAVKTSTFHIFFS